MTNLQEFALQTASTFVGGGFLTACGLAFVASHRAARLRHAMDLLLSTWDHYRDPDNKYNAQHFSDQTAIAVAEINEELATTDSAILRPNLKTRRALRRLLGEIKQYSDALTEGDGGNALHVAFIVLSQDTDDPEVIGFHRLLSRLATLRESIGIMSYFWIDHDCSAV